MRRSCILLGVMDAGDGARLGVTLCIFWGNVLVLLYFVAVLIIEYVHTMRREADYLMQG